MTKEEILKKITEAKDNFPAIGFSDDYVDGFNKGMQMSHFIVNKLLPATQEKQGWVKFTESKPVIGSKPLWLFKNGDVEEIGYDGIGYKDATHFLVLPQKPEV